MATSLQETTKVNGKWIHLVRYGYAEAPEVALMLYDLSKLNEDNLDFKSTELKGVSREATLTEDGESITWKEEDIKEAYLTVTTATSATSVVVDSTDVQVWETIYNQTTGETALVVAVSTNTLTLASPWFAGTGYAANNVLTRISFAKKYWVNHGHRVKRNDLITYTNYVQFTEELIDSDMIENNKTYLFVTPEQRTKMIYSDASRKIIKGIVSSFYLGKKMKTNASGEYQYSAGWLIEFVPAANRVNIKGADDTATKANLRYQLQKAYQCGLKWIYGKNKLLAFCTTKFAADLDALYENKIIYNDKLNAVDVQIKSYNVWGFVLNIVVSNVLDYDLGDVSKCFLVPIEYTFLFMLPKGVTGKDGKTLDVFGRWVLYDKPQETYEKKTQALATNFSFYFKGISSGAYRILTIA